MLLALFQQAVQVASLFSVQWIDVAVEHVESAVMRLKADMEHAVARALSVFDGLGTRPAVAAPEAEAAPGREAPPEPPSSVPVHTAEHADTANLPCAALGWDAYEGRVLSC